MARDPRPTAPRSRRLSVAVVACAAAVVVIASASPASAKTYTFDGRGWGHGLGMSQWGARGLAERGLTAPQILKTYYTGVEVQPKALPDTIRVGLLQERAEIYVEGNGAFGLYDRTGVKKANGAAGERWTVKPKGSALEVYAPGATTPKFTSGVPVTVRYEDKGTQIKLPQTKFSYKHGRIDIDINASTDKTRAILIVPFEQYLYGLAEMPSSWHHEALDAQAIAGRTYALEKSTRLGQSRSVCNCAVYATTADQVYAGTSHEVTRWVAAVDATRGEVVTYGGKAIQAYYSSSSGGFTENNENVFGGAALPYLRGVCDPGDYVGGENPNANWSVSLDSSEIQTKLRDAGYNTGPIQSITYLAPRGVSGRVLSIRDETHGGVKVTGSVAAVRLSGSAFRSALGLKSNLILYNVIGAIRLRYDGLKCSPGLPKGNEFTWNDLDDTVRGKAQTFAHGRLFFNNDSGVVKYVKGTILARYDAARAAGTDLGMPTSDETIVKGGKMSSFEHGNIYWSSRYLARVVSGAILTKYLNSGGPTKWGMPTTDELAAPNEGRSQRFEKARIYWSRPYGARGIIGSILNRYLELGGATGRLGMPKSDEYGISTGTRQDFAHGYITFNATTGQTAYKVT